MFDYIIVGAGLAGSVMAERIANVLNKKVLVIEQRSNIGGNCYDYYDKNGILVHKYGPHIFHTNSKKVWRYLSQFTEWRKYEHKVLGYVDGKKVPIPFNLNTLHALLPGALANDLENKLIDEFGLGTKIPILDLKKSTDEDFRFISDFVYEKIFLNYTTKQWGMKPEELDPSVTERVPVYISHDNRYFQDRYQGIPKNGYQKMFENILNNPNIKLMINKDFKELIKIKKANICFKNNIFKGLLIFTGRIDELFDYKFDKLPYRSLIFKFETFKQKFYQEVGTVNYPNDYNFTRITEFKHITGQENPKTTITKEYPKVFDHERDIPCYPIPKKEYDQIYEKYRETANNIKNLIVIGRLAEYKYLNMDAVVERALISFEERIQ